MLQFQPLPSPIVHRPEADLPVFLSVPHSGRDYPDWLVEHSRRGSESLRALEDPLVDLLIAPSLSLGIGAVVARAPRAAVDCNRAEDEIDPTVVATGPLNRLSARARGGLGIIPGRTARDGHLWKHPIRRHELESRLACAHRPYHSAIEHHLAALANRHGCALLLDCHSMPSLSPGGPGIVVGDRHCTSAAPWLAPRAAQVAARCGYTTAINAPFAGGHISERHGRPQAGVHALQIEIDRASYLAADGSLCPSGSRRAASLLEVLAVDLGTELLRRAYPAAAE